MECFNPQYQITDAMALDLMAIAQTLSLSDHRIPSPDITPQVLIKALYNKTGEAVVFRTKEQATFLPKWQKMHRYPTPTDIQHRLSSLLTWLKVHQHTLPHPLRAGIAYQAMIQLRPFAKAYETAAATLANLILAQYGHLPNALNNLEQNHCRHLLTASLVEKDLTTWLAWFCHHLNQPPVPVRNLTDRQRLILALFKDKAEISSRDVGTCLNLKDRARAHVCQKWVERGFLEIANPSNKARTYRLTVDYRPLVMVVVGGTTEGRSTPLAAAAAADLTL